MLTGYFQRPNRDKSCYFKNYRSLHIGWTTWLVFIRTVLISLLKIQDLLQCIMIFFYEILVTSYLINGLPRWLSDIEPACQCRRHRRWRLVPWVGKIPWKRAWTHTRTHSCILAWRIPWTEETGGLQSMGSQRVGHHWTC